MTARRDREIEDAQTALGCRVQAVYREGDTGAVTLILEGRDWDRERNPSNPRDPVLRRVVLTVMRDAEGNGPGALFVDEVAL